MVPINNTHQGKSNLILFPLPKLAKRWLYFIKLPNLAWKPSIAVQDVHIVQLSWSFLISICFTVGVQKTLKQAVKKFSA